MEKREVSDIMHEYSFEQIVQKEGLLFEISPEEDETELVELDRKPLAVYSSFTGTEEFEQISFILAIKKEQLEAIKSNDKDTKFMRSIGFTDDEILDISSWVLVKLCRYNKTETGDVSKYVSYYRIIDETFDEIVSKKLFLDREAEIFQALNHDPIFLDNEYFW